MKKIIRSVTFLAVLVMVLACATNTVSATSSSKKKKDEKCYFAYVNLNYKGTTSKVAGGLKPIAVPADTSWNEYFSGVTVKNYKLITSIDGCDFGQHDIVTALVRIDDEWKELFYYDNEEKVTYFLAEELSIEGNCIDVKFVFNSYAGEYSSSCLYVRFAKSYNIFYNLDGGKFTGETLDYYTAGADYTLPTPVKEGYEFVGWTGSDLTTATKNVVIKNGAEGNKQFTAVWKSLSTPTQPTIKEPETTAAVKAPSRAKIKSAIRKAGKKVKVSIKKVKKSRGYKLQFSTTKSFKKVILTKIVKKNIVTVNSKKLKNKKKLFVRAKAYKLDGKKKILSKKWSVVKKVK